MQYSTIHSAALPLPVIFSFQGGADLHLCHETIRSRAVDKTQANNTEIALAFDSSRVCGALRGRSYAG